MRDYKKSVMRALEGFGERVARGKVSAPRRKRISKPGASGVPSEHDEQVALCRWLDANGVVYFATANGAMLAGNGLERAMRWAKLAASGVSAGVPDIVICTPYNGGIVFVEMKRRDAKNRAGHNCSDKQLAWHKILRGVGHQVIIGCGADDAIDKLSVLGYGVTKSTKKSSV